MLKIGDTVYYFDTNRRVYPSPVPGDDRWGGGTPIWREHWRPMKITGETVRSWLVGGSRRALKMPKKGADGGTWAIDERDISRAAWVNDCAHRIADEVRRLGFADLAAVAKLISSRHQPDPPLLAREGE